MVSVCMATYNGEKFLREQIDSILSQLCQQDELIICDDSSTDKTTEIIKSYDDERIKLYVNDQQLGVIKNFEKALKFASNSFIFLADQDDTWHNSKVSVCTDLLRNADLVLSDCRLVDENGNFVEASYFQLRNVKNGFIRNLFKSGFVGSCMAFRKNVLDSCLPFPEQIPMHDWWIGLKASYSFKCVICPMPLVNHRVHTANLSTTGKKSTTSLLKKLTMRYKVIKCILTSKRSTG